MKILVATEKPFAAVAVQGIREVVEQAGHELVLVEKGTKADMIAAVADCAGLIVRSDKVDEEVFAAAPGLKVVVRAGAGYDNIDLAAATAHGVCVMNTPGQNSNAVAELVFGLLVTLARNNYNGTAGTELKDKTLGIHAYGQVGRNPSAYTIEAPQPQLVKADAADWAKKRMTLLVDKYMGSAGNMLNPDDVRMLFRPLGYTGPNALDYKEAENLVVDATYEKMLQKAQLLGKKDLVIVTGAPGCGKSFAAKQLKLRNAGLIYDAVLDGTDRLQQVIEKAKAAGMEKVTLVPVYNDILTCFQNTVSRGKSTWRYTAIDYLVSSFRNNVGKLEQISKAFPDLEILPVDCSHNQGAVRVTLEEAQKWNYTISDEEMKQVLSYLLAEINSGEIEAGSVPALVGDIRSIANVGEGNATLVNEIDQKTQAIIKEYKLR